jgi:hypothetical protein
MNKKISIRNQLSFLVDKNKCSLCPQNNTWNNLPIKMEMDHIDGNRQNNALSNLRFLCPNCHSQQLTSNRNKIGKRIKIDEKIIVNLYHKDKKNIREILFHFNLSDAGANYSYIKSVLLKNNVYNHHPQITIKKYKGTNILNSRWENSVHLRKVERPSKEELEFLIKKFPFTKLAKKYRIMLSESGVSCIV